MKKNLLLMGAILTCGIAANAQWVKQATAFAKPNQGINQIVILDANTVWATGYDGSGGNKPVRNFTRTSNGGTLWKADSVKATPAISPANQFAGITAISKDTAWVSLFGNGTTIGGIYRTNDGGVTWTAQTSAYSASSFEDWIYFWDKNNGVAFGDPNPTWEIYTTNNGGTTWTAVPAANVPSNLSTQWGVTGVFAVSGGSAYGGTNYGAVLKSVDMGMHWTATTVHAGSQIDKLVFKDANNGMAIVGPNNDSIFTTANGGTNWTYVPKTGRFLTTGLSYASGLNGGSYVCTGAGGPGMNGTSFSTNNGATWQGMDTSQQHTAVAFMGSTGWAGGFDSTASYYGIFKWMGMPFAINEIQPAYQTGLNVYPNPNNGTFQIALSNFTGNQTQIAVYDLVGNLVFESSENTAGNLYVKEVDLTAYPTGMYIVRVQDGAKVYTAKAIRQ